MIGKRLKELREKRGWTQSQIASKLGVASNTYNNYENDSRGVSETMLVSIANLFGVSLDFLMGRVNVPDAVLTAVERGFSDAIELEDEQEFLKLNILIGGKPLTKEEKKLFRALIRAKRGLE